MAEDLQQQGLDPMVELGWKKTGIIALFSSISLCMLSYHCKLEMFYVFYSAMW